VGGHCCFNIHEYSLVWSGDVGGDFRRCYIRPMLVRRSQAMGRKHMINITQTHTGSKLLAKIGPMHDP
jgi:hypothetical protein